MLIANSRSAFPQQIQQIKTSKNFSVSSENNQFSFIEYECNNIKFLFLFKSISEYWH